LWTVIESCALNCECNKVPSWIKNPANSLHYFLRSKQVEFEKREEAVRSNCLLLQEPFWGGIDWCTIYLNLPSPSSKRLTWILHNTKITTSHLKCRFFLLLNCAIRHLRRLDVHYMLFKLFVDNLCVGVCIKASWTADSQSVVSDIPGHSLMSVSLTVISFLYPSTFNRPTFLNMTHRACTVYYSSRTVTLSRLLLATRSARPCQGRASGVLLTVIKRVAISWPNGRNGANVSYQARKETFRSDRSPRSTLPGLTPSLR
jgi:hypothetical protein